MEKATGGHLGWEGRVTLGEGFLTVSFSVELQCPYLLSCQAGTPRESHTKENPTQDTQPPTYLKGEDWPPVPM